MAVHGKDTNFLEWSSHILSPSSVRGSERQGLVIQKEDLDPKRHNSLPTIIVLAAFCFVFFSFELFGSK